jgi:hypothetical protein
LRLHLNKMFQKDMLLDPTLAVIDFWLDNIL